MHRELGAPLVFPHLKETPPSTHPSPRQVNTGFIRFMPTFIVSQSFSASYQFDSQAEAQVLAIKE